MNIGTAKPTAEELSAIPHHLIGHISITAPYSVGRYVKEATQKIEELHLQSDFVIVVGGTGMYIKGLTEGVDEFPDVDDSILVELQNIYESEGITVLQEELKKKDPTYYTAVDHQNPHRVIRALSVIRMSGNTFSSYLNQPRPKHPWKPILLALSMDRQILYDRINRRVDLMMDAGLLDEVKGLVSYRDLRSLDTVGYKEIFHHLDGSMTLPEAVNKIKQHSRNYAKRQMTWFTNQQAYHHFEPQNISRMLDHISEITTGDQA